MYPHPIRLRGAWDYEVLSGEAAAARGRVKLLSDWGASLGPGFEGRVRFRRTFHRPGNLDPHEHVWLVGEGLDTSGQVFCNGHRLDGTGEFEITGLLAAQNEVLLEVELPGGAVGEVRLEVRERQFLDGWRLWMERVDGGSMLRLEGRVAGEPHDAPLELVVRGLEEELLYVPVMAGSEISLSALMPEACLQSPTGQMGIEIRLIRGGVRVWEARQFVALSRAVDCADGGAC